MTEKKALQIIHKMKWAKKAGRLINWFFAGYFLFALVAIIVLGTHANDEVWDSWIAGHMGVFFLLVAASCLPAVIGIVLLFTKVKYENSFMISSLVAKDQVGAYMLVSRRTYDPLYIFLESLPDVTGLEVEVYASDFQVDTDNLMQLNRYPEGLMTRISLTVNFEFLDLRSFCLEKLNSDSHHLSITDNLFFNGIYAEIQTSLRQLPIWSETFATETGVAHRLTQEINDSVVFPGAKYFHLASFCVQFDTSYEFGFRYTPDDGLISIEEYLNDDDEDVEADDGGEENSE